MVRKVFQERFNAFSGRCSISIAEELAPCAVQRAQQTAGVSVQVGALVGSAQQPQADTVGLLPIHQAGRNVAAQGSRDVQQGRTASARLFQNQRRMWCRGRCSKP